MAGGTGADTLRLGEADDSLDAGAGWTEGGVKADGAVATPLV